ncbi:MAG: RNA methyltransferase, partial [Candidatus Bathyarchaeota archaeon]|nr:RNA methyltransferase [Candidatus Bathyarchaeota archaeon]
GEYVKIMAANAVDVVNNASIFRSLDEAVKDLDVVVGTTAIYAKKPSNIRRTTIFPEEFASKVKNISNCKIGVVFGRESSGLTNSELELCDFSVTIPASQEYPVLNVATAAAIIFYEVYKNIVLEDKVSYIPVASKDDREKVIRYFTAIMDETNLQDHKKRLALQSFKSIISRSFLSVKEAYCILTVFHRLHQLIKILKSKT